MSWLKRLFGQDKPNNVQRAISGQPAAASPSTTTNPVNPTSGGEAESIPPERVGLHGEYDQSGLAKRVALAFDEDPDLDDIETLFVAQTGTTVVLKGKAPDQKVLTKMVSVARGVNGATAVETDQVTIA